LKAEILVITDRSGSMAAIAKDVIGGYNTFIEDQKKVPGEAKVTFTQFDTDYEVVYAGKTLTDVPMLDHNTFVPRGGTALLDAIGRTLNEQGQRIATEDWADLVIVCIITDGEENSSREFTRERIQEMTAHAEKNGWKFIYIGANQNSFQVAQGLGMKQAITANYVANAAGTAEAYRGVTASVTSLRSGN
jgi:hypothetical protein